MKLLVVEDNIRVARDIQKFLGEQGFVVELAATVKEASEHISVYEYDLVVVDLGLPDGSGLDLVREIKQETPELAILILTARDSVDDKVKGLELGADDYMTKPFHKAELNARIRSVLRRNKFNRSNTIEFSEIRVDLLASQAYVHETPLSLTRKEYDLLIYFLQNPNRLLTRESIAEYLWGDHIDQVDSFDFIYNHIKNLRRKITEAGGRNCIRAMYGMGYKFLAEPS